MALTKIQGSGISGGVNLKAINGAYTGGLLIEDDSNTTKSAITHVVGTMAMSANASTDHMLITADGEVTMPTQPSFLVRPTNPQYNVGIVDGTPVVVTFDNEIYDVGGNFASNAFTAPVTGKYLLSVSMYLSALDSAANFIAVYIYTSNRYYLWIIDPDFGQDATYWTPSLTCVADMDANDTVNVRFAQYTGTIQTDINTDSSFSGILIG